MKKLYLSILILSIGLYAKSQDALFTQFMFSPIAINPALTGVDSEFRGCLNSNKPWLNSNAGIVNTNLSLDIDAYPSIFRRVSEKRFRKYKKYTPKKLLYKRRLGMGISYQEQRSLISPLTNQEFSLYLSGRVYWYPSQIKPWNWFKRVNYTRENTKASQFNWLGGGIKLGRALVSTDWSQFTFSDQLNQDGYLISNQTTLNLPGDSYASWLWSMGLVLQTQVKARKYHNKIKYLRFGYSLSNLGLRNQFTASGQSDPLRHTAFVKFYNTLLVRDKGDAISLVSYLKSEYQMAYNATANRNLKNLPEGGIFFRSIDGTALLRFTVSNPLVTRWFVGSGFRSTFFTNGSKSNIPMMFGMAFNVGKSGYSDLQMALSYSPPITAKPQFYNYGMVDLSLVLRLNQFPCDFKLPDVYNWL